MTAAPEFGEFLGVQCSLTMEGREGRPPSHPFLGKKEDGNVAPSLDTFTRILINKLSRRTKLAPIVASKKRFPRKRWLGFGEFRPTMEVGDD